MRFKSFFLEKNLNWGLELELELELGRLGDLYTGLVAQTLAPKKHFSSFVFFQLYFNKRYAEVAINDFVMHLIKLFRNDLEDKDADGRKNNETKTYGSEKRYCLRKCFHLFKK